MKKIINFVLNFLINENQNIFLFSSHNIYGKIYERKPFSIIDLSAVAKYREKIKELGVDLESVSLFCSRKNARFRPIFMYVRFLN